MSDQPPQQHADPALEASRPEETGDIVIDSALEDLRNVGADDLDAHIETGQRVQQTLQARLGDLGGE